MMDKKQIKRNNPNVDIFYRGNYLNSSITCLKGTTIREYDMKSAGFSMIKAHKLLPAEKIEYLESLSHDKLKLNIAIGKIRKDDENFSTSLSKCIRETVFLFLVENNINSNDLLSIKNDAVFIIGKEPINILKINGGTFTLDHVFSSYYFINNKEFYFNSLTSELVVKGLGNEVVEKHLDYLLYEFKYLFQQSEILDFNTMLKTVKEFKNEYLTRQLDLSCYRELNGDNRFVFKNVDSTRDIVYSHENLSELNSDIYLDKIDISYNYIHYILPLMTLLLK